MRAEILNICEILDTLGSRNPSVELKSNGLLEPAESLALEESLRGAFHRFQELQQKPEHAEAPVLPKAGNEAIQIHTQPPSVSEARPEEAPQGGVTYRTVEPWHR
jgi:hypothetical protein